MIWEGLLGFHQRQGIFQRSIDVQLQIGELSNGLSDEFRESTKDRMPWGMIRGMRNWLAHAYSSADENMIWETAVNDIPKLCEFCDSIIEEQST